MPGEACYYKTMSNKYSPGKVMERLVSRSYVIEAANRDNKFRKNRKHAKAAVSAQALEDEELSFPNGTNKSAMQNVDFDDENIDYDYAMPCTESPSKIHSRPQIEWALPAFSVVFCAYYNTHSFQLTNSIHRN